LYGKPKNVDGSGPESNLKVKVKDEAKLTWMQAMDFELRTAQKDYKTIVLHAGASEIVRIGKSAILPKYIANLQLCNDDEVAKQKRKGTMFLFREDENNKLFIVPHNKKYANREWKGLVSSQELATFLSPLKLEIASIHMQYNSQTGIKYRGNPMENQHDWATVQYNNNVIMCQFLCFLDVIDAKEVLSMALDDIDERGMYAIVHFVGQNVFDHKPTKPLYGTVHNKGYAFHVHQNCMLVTGWAKHTNMIDGPMLILLTLK